MELRKIDPWTVDVSQSTSSGYEKHVSFEQNSGSALLNLGPML
jgi:hypothetical protein